jgi:dTDP-4-dehydrorhamnose reductase
MKKVLILGVKGGLGGQLYKIFNTDEYSVTGWDKDDLDITDKELINKKITDIKPDVIINATAYNAVDKCEEDDNAFDLAKKLNAEAVGNLADAAIKIGAIIMHYVSDYVFDGKKKQGYKEDDETNPVSRYGKSKEMGEKEIIKRSSQSLRWYLIRTSKLFGPKADNENSKESFFDLMLRKSQEPPFIETPKGKMKELKIVHKEEISCFTYTPDLATQTKKLIEEEKPFGIYHVINPGASSWYDGAKYLFELKGIKNVKLVPIKSADYPRPAKRPKYSVLLNTKLPPLRSWQEALREYIK